MAKRSAWGSLERRGNSWDARWTDPVTRKPRRRVVGKVRELGERVSEERKREILEAVRESVEPSPGETFHRFLLRYEPLYRMRVRESTAETTLAQMRNVARLLDGPMDAVDVPRAEEVLARVAAGALSLGNRPRRPLSPNTIRLYATRLAVFWRAALERGVVRTNPWLRVGRPRKRRAAVVNVQLPALDAAVRVVPAELAPLVKFLAETGLRIGEAAALRWQDVDGAWLTVREGKTGPRQVPLTRRAREALAEVPKNVQPSALVFPMLRSRGRRSYRLRLIREAMARAGIEPLRFREIRRSPGQRAARLGYGAHYVADFLGNTPEVAQESYMRGNPNENAATLRDAMDREAAAHDASLALKSQAK